MDNDLTPRRKILVVDDDVEASRLIEDVLKLLGYDSVVCRHAQEAMAYLRFNRVDLMLVDYRMPEITGLDLISMLREEGREIPAIMMTGYISTKDRISSPSLGLSAILTKPIAIPQLTEALDKVFSTGSCSRKIKRRPAA